jgi:hypothetical protein
VTRLRFALQDSEIKRFFQERTTVVDLSGHLTRFLFEDGETPSLKDVFADLGVDPRRCLVMVSGWGFVERATPQRSQKALAQLMRQLLLELETLERPVLWFARPHHTELTTEVYQKRVVEPYRESSALAGCVREIVWDIPVRPYAVGQKTPLIDDVRVIIRESPTVVERFLTSIPPLRDWSSKFSSEQQREHRGSGSSPGRNPLTADDVLTDPHLSYELIAQAQELVGLSDGRSVVTDSTVLLVERVPAASTRRMGGMSSPVLTFRQSSLGGKAGLAYVAVSSSLPRIDRPREYRAHGVKTPPVERCYRPPLEQCLIVDEIDEEEAYYQEIERLHAVLNISYKVRAEHGSTQKLDDLLSGLKLVLATDTPAGRVVRDATNLLRNQGASTDLWRLLEWHRENGLKTGLPVSVARELKGAREKTPDLYLNTGNHLFLLLLLTRAVVPTLSDDDVVELWNRIKTWQLLQLGLCMDESVTGQAGQATFDVRALWSQLFKRAQRFDVLCSPCISRVLYGQLLAVEGLDLVDDYWLIVQQEPESAQMMAGLWTGVNPLDPSKSIRWSAVGDAVSTERARRALYPLGRIELAILEDSSGCHLWVHEDLWAPVGEVSIIKRRHEGRMIISGIRLKTMTHSSLQDTVLRRPPQELDTNVKAELNRIADLYAECVAVRCSLHLEPEHLVARFHAPSAGDAATLEEVRVEHTQDFIELLRRPLVQRGPIDLGSADGSGYSWNPYTDIDYGDLAFLRPYVERRRPFTSVAVTLPATAAEILSSSTDEIRLVVRHDNESCPIWLGIDNHHDQCWYLDSPDTEEDNRYSKILRAPMSDYELHLMMTAEQIHLDGATYSVEFEFEPDPTSPEGTVFRESRLFCRVIGCRRVPPGSFVQLDEERLVWSLGRDGSWVTLTLRSSITGDVVHSAPLVKRARGVDVEEMLENVEEILQGIINLRYSESDFQNKVVSPNELFRQLSKIIEF